MVEVTGIEPVSKDKTKAESTCLVIFLSFVPGRENDQNLIRDYPALVSIGTAGEIPIIAVKI